MEVIFYLKLVITFIKRFKWLLIAGILIGVALFLLLRVLSPVLNRKITYVGYIGRYHTDDLPHSVLSMVSDGLTTVDASGQASPALSDHWEASQNGKVWTFHIDASKKWHDGTQVTSNDIQYTFETATIDRPDKETIRFTLEAPYAPFPLIVSKPVFKKGLLGTGEWKVSRVNSNGGFIDEMDLVMGNQTKVLRFYPSEEQLKTGFQLGEIDRMEDVFDITPFDSWNTVNINQKIEKSEFVALFFNNQSDLLKDKSVRQALSYAVDKSKFGPNRAISPISPDSWSYNPQVKTYDYDLKHATELLKDIPQSARASMSLTISTIPLLLHDAETIAKEWKDLGITTTVQVVTSVPTDYDVFLAIYGIPEDPDQYQTWHSTQKDTNVTHFQSPRIDKLLEDGRMELDLTKRKKIYLDFQRFLLEEAPAAFLYHPVSYAIERK